MVRLPSLPIYSPTQPLDLISEHYGVTQGRSFGLKYLEARASQFPSVEAPNRKKRGAGYTPRGRMVMLVVLLIVGRSTRGGPGRSLATRTRSCRPRHGGFSDLLQCLCAKVDFPRSGSAAFVRLRGSAPGVQRSRQGGPVLRHGLLGRGPDLVSPDMGAAFSR